MQRTGQASRASSSFWNAKHSPLPATRGHPLLREPRTAEIITLVTPGLLFQR